jgi:hypothetical protein
MRGPAISPSSTAILVPRSNPRLPHAGDPGIQRALQESQVLQHRIDRRPRPFALPIGKLARQVDMAINEAGQQIAPRSVNHTGIRAPAHRGLRPHGGDLIVADEDGRSG